MTSVRPESSRRVVNGGVGGNSTRILNEEWWRWLITQLLISWVALVRTASHFAPEDVDFLITFSKMQFPHSIRLKDLEELLKP